MKSQTLKNQIESLKKATPIEIARAMENLQYCYNNKEIIKAINSSYIMIWVAYSLEDIISSSDLHSQKMVWFSLDSLLFMIEELEELEGEELDDEEEKEIEDLKKEIKQSKNLLINADDIPF